ncbi:ABC transporter family substrate-binding protein [Corynebacterium sp. TAE3-ERU30]|uniref:ABC transporter family substrate-binding protein n=1 Tax=Corynebacterium sp. TAE3-ERU30 TaxID=2849496 RepID=UPI001C44E3BF|nr:ABC transporter family substrate-binding protein [Corynebacterium sp. TAE3-ERU30]MBV7281840.1 ABC transporter family substrate-binding protein [Corynebacterium sp. TAE3-ERU30]
MKLHTPTKKLVAVLSASALALAACGDDGSGSVSTTDGAGVPDADFNEQDRDNLKDGGTLTTAIGEISEQQNPFHADGTLYSTIMWSWYNPMTVHYSPEGEWSTDPNYILDVKEEEEDGKTKLTYEINEDATFNDGTPIDWRAWETTWKINEGKDEAYTPSSTDGYEQITSVEKGETDKEAVVTFAGTYPWWQGLFNFIAHPELANPDNYNSYLKEVHPEWGAGPFKIEDVDFQNGNATFVRNEKWWGDTAKLDKRVFRQMESQAAINAFKNGEIDAVSASSRSDYAAVKDLADTEIYVGRAPKNTLFLLNGESDILKDIKVREAFAKGLDREQLADIWYQGLPAKLENPGSFIFYPFQKDYEDNFEAVAGYHPEEAKQILDEAGWTEGADGIREKDGEKLTLRYVLVGESDLVKSSAQATQQMLKNIGIDISIDVRPSSEFSKTLQSKNYDIFPMGFSSSDPYGVAYFGQTYRSDSQLNRSNTGTPELDEKIAELQKLPTREEQIKRSNELEKEALARYGILPINTALGVSAVKSGLANVGPMAFGDVPIENIGWVKE